MAGVPGVWIKCQHSGGDYVFTVHVPDGAGDAETGPERPAANNEVPENREPIPQQTQRTRRCYEVTFSPEALELVLPDGQIMGIDVDGYHTLHWEKTAGLFVLRYFRGLAAPDSKPVDPPFIKTAEQIIAGLCDRQTFDAEAATLDDGPATTARPVYNPTTLNQLRRIRDRVREMGNTARSREWAFDEMLALIDAGPESIREKPWRLPTLEETLADPEAARVWNAVNKPPLEWHRSDDGLPPISPQAEGRSVWVLYSPDFTPVMVPAWQLHDWANKRQVVPAYWCEVEPAPPFVEPPAATREPLAEANERMRAAVAQTNAARAERDRATS